jgi:two-component system response regulator YesN
MKVILVDDEPMAIEHMRSLVDWESLGYRIIGTASNGAAALQLSEQHLPQIMIVDVRMPIMDGLELIRNISARNLGIKFIITTAYRDFDYAQRAIELGVSSFLVKHSIDHERLMKELFKVSDLWRYEESSRLMGEQGKIRRLLINGTSNHLHWEKTLPSRLFVMIAQEDIPFGAERQEHDQSKLDWWSEDAIEHLQSSVMVYHGGVPIDGQYILILSLTGVSEKVCREWIHNTMRKLQYAYRTRFDKTLSFYWCTSKGQANDMKTAYMKTRVAANHALFMGRQALFSIDELPYSLPKDTHHESHLELNTLRQAMMDNIDPVPLKKWMNDMFHNIRYPVWKLNDLMKLTECIARFVNPHMENSSSLHSIFDGKEIYDMNALKEFLYTIAMEKDTLKGSPFSSRINKALRYIQSNYNKDLSIEETANAQEISPSYLHYLFKKELNQTFLRYVTEYRIRQAKIILKNENARIDDVAERVGYKNTSHFCHIFKRATRLTPHQYREKGEP